MIYKILLPVLIALFISGQFVYSQAPGGGAPAGGATGTTGPAGGGIPAPGDFPSYIVTPREDLDNYNLSTQKRTDFKGNRENVSNFGETPVQKNNYEVNAEIQKLEEQRKNPGDAQPDQIDAQPDQIDDTTGFDDQNIGTNDEGSYVQPGGANSLYRWVDKEGVIHVTDDVNSIPAEYMDQVYKGK